MDPIVLAAGTALVGAMASDAWQHARDATVALWRRARPASDEARTIGTELDVLRTRIRAARAEADEDTEEALRGAWRLRLQHLLAADPALAAELRLLLDEHLTPAAAPEAGRPGAAGPTVTQTVEAHDNSRVFMAGRDQHITGA
ncbi:hypothetical protein ACWEPM_16535 [Streptomyces sp. NPDC004244]|uniref:hypothetical protein n=1 Tax=Streptomyces sp. NPDC101206 TaxID=3366128 RepID=UPI00380D2A7E